MASEKEKQARHSAKSAKSEKEKTHSTKSPASRVEKPKGEKETHETRARASKGSENKAPETRLAPGESARTTDHARIRQWVEERGGSPAAVKATEKGEDPGLLRINFPGYSGAGRLEDISWEDFFQKFDEKHLEFLYQEKTRDGNPSRFWKLVTREEHK